jgi:hypothetical protein
MVGGSSDLLPGNRLLQEGHWRRKTQKAMHRNSSNTEKSNSQLTFAGGLIYQGRTIAYNHLYAYQINP